MNERLDILNVFQLKRFQTCDALREYSLAISNPTCHIDRNSFIHHPHPFPKTIMFVLKSTRSLCLIGCVIAAPRMMGSQTLGEDVSSIRLRSSLDEKRSEIDCDEAKLQATAVPTDQSASVNQGLGHPINERDVEFPSNCVGPSQKSAIWAASKFRMQLPNRVNLAVSKCQILNTNLNANTSAP